jgi:hypothetical protein
MELTCEKILGAGVKSSRPQIVTDIGGKKNGSGILCGEEIDRGEWSAREIMWEEI